MSELISDFSNTVFFNLLQIAAGSLISMILFLLFNKQLKRILYNSIVEITVITICAILGIILPLDTFGVIPILSVLIMMGMKPALVLPLLVSNAFFNMLVPYSDPSFIWRAGMKRVIFALIAAVLAGMILRKLKRVSLYIPRMKVISSIGALPAKPKDAVIIPLRNISILGPYLFIGALFEVLFLSYGYKSAIHFIFTNSTTSSVPNFFSSKSVGNPFFILTTKIADLLMDITKLSAIASIIKLRGILLYYIYFGLLAFILASSIFLK